MLQSFRPSSPPKTDSLKKWWANFKARGSSTPINKIFGVDLTSSLITSSRTLELSQFPGVEVVIPNLVAKCTQYLDQYGCNVQGVFRVSGSIKRMQELQSLFELGPSYGENADLKELGFTPHDVAGVLTRYLNALPEPVITNSYFETFRAVYAADDSVLSKVNNYHKLLLELPTAHGHLILYLLDFLGKFATHHEKTLMPASNLAAVFQPSVLNTSEHRMKPDQYKQSQLVINFLIINYINFATSSIDFKNNTSEVLSKDSSGVPLSKRHSTGGLLTKRWLNRSRSDMSASNLHDARVAAAFNNYSTPSNNNSGLMTVLRRASTSAKKPRRLTLSNFKNTLI